MNKRLLLFTLFAIVCLIVGMVLVEAMRHTIILPEYRKIIGDFEIITCGLTLGFCLGFIMVEFSFENKWVNVIFNIIRNSFVVLQVLLFSFAILFACGVPFAMLYTYYPYVSFGAIVPFVGMEFLDDSFQDKVKGKFRKLFVGKPTAFYVGFFLDLVMFTLYSHITYKVNMAIYKYSESAWPYWVNFIFAALLIDRVYRIYGNFKKYYDVGSNDNLVLVKKRRELLKMRQSLEASISLVQRLKKDKVKYQEKIEARLQENPDAEDAKIDVFLSEIDRLDSRIAIGESTREKFESKVNILIGECNALERIPEPEPETQEEDIALPDNDEAEEELNYYNRELATLRGQREEILEILGRVRPSMSPAEPALQRAEDLLLRLEERIRNVERRIFENIQNRAEETIIHSTTAYNDYVNRNLR